MGTPTSTISKRSGLYPSLHGCFVDFHQHGLDRHEHSGAYPCGPLGWDALARSSSVKVFARWSLHKVSSSDVFGVSEEVQNDNAEHLQRSRTPETRTFFS